MACINIKKMEGEGKIEKKWWRKSVDGRGDHTTNSIIIIILFLKKHRRIPHKQRCFTSF
jgi:hypothetical protein